LKPENVMIVSAETMEIKLIDFGLSGVIDDSRFVPKQYFDES
jgi:serine/threonine protein kinase